ncbi:MAG: HAD-IA family hydrolase [Acidimicrobiia bacterium]
MRAVLFDSGDTLLRPIGGRWNPRFDFEQVVLRHAPDVDASMFPAAFAEGQTFLDNAANTPDRDDYHRAMLRVLGVSEPSADLLHELDRPLNRPVVEPFPDVRRSLTELRSAGVRMAVVSDSWPNLEAIYRQLGLRDFFDGFAISTIVGCRKPDPRMYRAGSDIVRVVPADCLFVDDDPALVSAAMSLGYRGVTICREAERPDDVPSIESLDELRGLLALD